MVESKNQTILITGGAGYLGSVLVQKLIAAQTSWNNLNYQDRNESLWAFPFKKIIVYDNLMYKQTPLIEYCYRGDLEFIHGDVRDTKKLRPYMEQADVIIPLAALVGAPACDKDERAAEDINYKHVAFLCSHTKPETKIIYPNTNSGYGIGQKDKFCTEESELKPISWYGITKCWAESSVIARKGVSLRLATVFGVSPRMRLDLLVNDFVYKAVNDKYIVLFEHEFKRNYIHIHDVALTMIFAMFNYEKMAGQAYNVGLSSANLSKLELAQKIKEHIPFSINLDSIGQDLDKRDYIVSNAKLEALNWQPRYTLDDGIRELIKAYSILVPSNRKYTNL